MLANVNHKKTCKAGIHGQGRQIFNQILIISIGYPDASVGYSFWVCRLLDMRHRVNVTRKVRQKIMCEESNSSIRFHVSRAVTQILDLLYCISFQELIPRVKLT